MAKTVWVKFMKPGPIVGLAYHEGDIAQIDEATAKKAMREGVVVALDASEVPAPPAPPEK